MMCRQLQHQQYEDESPIGIDAMNTHKPIMPPKQSRRFTEWALIFHEIDCQCNDQSQQVLSASPIARKASSSYIERKKAQQNGYDKWREMCGITRSFYHLSTQYRQPLHLWTSNRMNTAVSSRHHKYASQDKQLDACRDTWLIGKRKCKCHSHKGCHKLKRMEDIRQDVSYRFHFISL